MQQTFTEHLLYASFILFLSAEETHINKEKIHLLSLWSWVWKEKYLEKYT